MITRIKSENIIVKDAIISGYVYFEDDKIIYVGNEERKFDKEINAGENYVSPGFIDLHTHGAVAGDYCAPKSKEEVLRALRYQNEHGATTIYPTLSACTFEQAISTLEIMREAMEANPSANVPGIHIEGPFFAVNQKGGQNAEYLTDADPDYYLPITEKYGDIISRWDYAPERDKDSKFGKFLKDKGITASIAHSDAEYEDVVRAIGDGVELVTHLYSCTSTITRRSGFRILGVTECAYLFDELNCELICDGKHLPPPLLKMIFKTKPHDKLILVTDSIPAAGMGGTGTEVNVLAVVTTKVGLNYRNVRV